MFFIFELGNNTFCMRLLVTKSNNSESIYNNKTSFEVVLLHVDLSDHDPFRYALQCFWIYFLKENPSPVGSRIHG